MYTLYFIKDAFWALFLSVALVKAVKGQSYTMTIFFFEHFYFHSSLKLLAHNVRTSSYLRVFAN